MNPHLHRARRILILVAVLAGSAILSPGMRAPLSREQVIPAVAVVSAIMVLAQILLRRR
ncbi:MAG: hypothetical protein ABUS49_02340 [Acidobacteriota bacterium]